MAALVADAHRADPAVSHVHAYEEPGHPKRCVDIAANVCLEPTNHSLVPAGSGIPVNSPEAEPYGEELYGFIVGHEREGLDHRCEGAVAVCQHAHPGKGWSMTGTLEGGDLTLSPSIQCRNTLDGEDCAFHGYVRAGKWVPA
jgi:hypothetical protein